MEDLLSRIELHVEELQLAVEELRARQSAEGAQTDAYVELEEYATVDEYDQNEVVKWRDDPSDPSSGPWDNPHYERKRREREKREKQKRERLRRRAALRRIKNKAYAKKLRRSLIRELERKGHSKREAEKKVPWDVVVRKTKRFVNEHIDMKKGRLRVHREKNEDWSCDFYVRVRWNSGPTLQLGMDCEF